MFYLKIRKTLNLLVVVYLYVIGIILNNYWKNGQNDAGLLFNSLFL